MPTLLLQCVAPLQSWGTQSNFSVRDTGREPSRSGIVGLLCAALGRPRTESVADLAALKMGVRVDQEGQILRDFQTAGLNGFLRADGKGVSQGTLISNRYYLADAVFLVGLEGHQQLLDTLWQALSNPRWMLFLGRKACPPARPPYLPDGLQNKRLRQALEVYPWLGTDEDRHSALVKEDFRLRLIFERADGPDVRQDFPLSFQKGNRQFALRRIMTDFTSTMPPFRHPLMKEDVPS